MAQQLIESFTRQWKPEKYKDTYQDELLRGDQGEAEGQGGARRRRGRGRGAAGTDAALRASLESAKGGRRRPRRSTPPQRVEEQRSRRAAKSEPRNARAAKVGALEDVEGRADRRSPSGVTPPTPTSTSSTDSRSASSPRRERAGQAAAGRGAGRGGRRVEGAAQADRPSVAGQPADVRARARRAAAADGGEALAKDRRRRRPGARRRRSPEARQEEQHALSAPRRTRPGRSPRARSSAPGAADRALATLASRVAHRRRTATCSSAAAWTEGSRRQGSRRSPGLVGDAAPKRATAPQGGRAEMRSSRRASD